MDQQRSPSVRKLLAYIEAYENAVGKSWHPDAAKIIKRYKDERSEGEASKPRFNVLWSNVETLKPFLYSATPKPIVSVRHDDAPDVVRVAANVLERALGYTVAEEHFGSALRNARDDYLLAGRGTTWVRYRPTYIPAAPQISESAVSDDPAQAAVHAGEGEEGDEQVTEVVGWEEAIADYVHWRDFGHNIAPTWEEVDVVWRRVPMDRDALRARFDEPEAVKRRGGKKIADQIPLDWGDREREQRAGTTMDTDPTARAGVYECWWKSKRQAFWITKTWPEALDELDDPLELDHFFPTPRPIYATLTTDSLIPTPDFRQYRDQANEIDDLTARIAALTGAIKAAGVYDANVPALQRLLEEGHDNTLIPVDSWAALAEKGGLKGTIELLPMQEIAETLLALHQARDAQKADLYEVTGMSDIIRGNTAPEETATAQTIKANFASKRLAERQAAVERFAANTIAIMGNVIARHFDAKTLAAMTGLQLAPAPAPQPMPGQMPGQAPQPVAPNAQPQPTWDDVIGLLRNEPQRRFAISVETDSLVAADDQQEQAARTQFLEAIGQFIGQAIPAVEQNPGMAPLMGHMLMFAVRGFRVGRDLDEAFEQFTQQMEAKAAQPQPPKPDPEMAKVQGQLQLQQQAQQFDQEQREAEFQHKAAMEQADQQHAHAMAVGQAQQSAGEAQQAAQMEVLKAQLDQQTEAHKAAIDAALQQQQAQFEGQIEQFKAMLQARTAIEVAEIGAGASLQAAEITAANAATEGDDE